MKFKLLIESNTKIDSEKTNLFLFLFQISNFNLLFKFRLLKMDSVQIIFVYIIFKTLK